MPTQKLSSIHEIPNRMAAKTILGAFEKCPLLTVTGKTDTRIQFSTSNYKQPNGLQITCFYPKAETSVADWKMSMLASISIRTSEARQTLALASLLHEKEYAMNVFNRNTGESIFTISLVPHTSPDEMVRQAMSVKCMTDALIRNQNTMGVLASLYPDIVKGQKLEMVRRIIKDRTAVNMGKEIHAMEYIADKMPINDTSQ